MAWTVEAVQKGTDEYNAKMRKGEYQGFVKTYAEDAVVMPNNGKIIKGIHDIEQWLKETATKFYMNDKAGIKTRVQEVKTEITLGWIYMFMGVLIGSAVIPVGLCLIWDRLTTNGMCAGPICGTFLGIMAWLITGQTHSGGLSHFFTNTGSEWSMLIGNVVSLGAGGVISVIVSYIDSRTMGKLEKEEIWEATLDIDNPIYSWTELYKKELNLKNAHKLDNRPSLVDIEKTFASARKVAVWGSLVLTIILLVIWPGAAAAVGVFSLNQFQAWIVVSIVWGILAGLCIIIIPVFGEIRSSIDAIREGRLVHSAATSAEQYSNI